MVMRERVPVGNGGVQKVTNLCLLALLLLFSPGCAIRPSNETVKDLVVEYFEGRGYRVKMLDIGAIEGGSMGEKVYMSPRGYKAVIRVITLEVSKEVGPPWNYRRGQTFTFHDGVIRFRESQSVPSRWEVSGIEGIPVR